MRPEPLDVRARVAVVALGITMLVYGASLLVDLQVRSAVDRMLGGEQLGYAELGQLDDRVSNTFLGQIVMLALCAVAFLLWFHRAYGNALAMGITRPRYTSGWAIGWWFVPLANLVMVKNVANDLYRGSDPDMTYGDPNFVSRPVSPLVHLWWGIWLLSNFVSAYGLRGVPRGEYDPTTLGDRLTLSVAGDALTLVAGAVAIAMVLQITRMSESRRYRFIQAMPAVPPASPALLAPPAYGGQPQAMPAYAARPMATPQPGPQWSAQPQPATWPAQPAAAPKATYGSEPPPLYPSHPVARTSQPPPLSSQPPPLTPQASPGGAPTPAFAAPAPAAQVPSPVSPAEHIASAPPPDPAQRVPDEGWPPQQPRGTQPPPPPA